MSTNICIFEDIYYARLLPLVFFRPVYNLRCGITSLKEKIIRTYPKAQVSLHCRPYLADYMRLRNPGVKVNDLVGESCLFINGRLIADPSIAKNIPLEVKQDVVYVNGDQVIAAHVSGVNLKKMKKKLNDLISLSDFDGLDKADIDLECIAYPWDVVRHNGAQIRHDFEWATKVNGRKKRIKGRVCEGVHLLDEENLFIDEGAVVKPGVVLDAEEGPIYIGKNVRIFPQATIIGPAYIGDGSWIKVGSAIYENTSIGPVCKVGGEVEDSIIHGFSNKQHAGFLGHSYIGTWVNLGADTNNSDLKNNYGSVKVAMGGELIDTGLQFVGLTMGDHSKSAINSMFNTGTIVGVSSNIFGSGFPPKNVPSFSWGAAGETLTTYNVDRAIDVARRVMARRKIELTATEEKLFRKIFDLTSEERRRRGMPS